MHLTKSRAQGSLRWLLIGMVMLGLAMGLGAEEEKSHLVAKSPDGKVLITVAQPLPVSVSKDDATRWVGEDDGAPERVQIVDAASKKVLGEVKGEAGGPLAASWREDSRYVILTWRGYRANWDKRLVHLNSKNEVIVLDPEFIDLMRADHGPAQKAEAAASDKLDDYPFEKKRWMFALEDWTKDGNLLIHARELAREPGDPWRFEARALSYTIEAKVEQGKFHPVQLTRHLADGGSVEVLKAPKTSKQTLKRQLAHRSRSPKCSEAVTLPVFDHL